MFIFRLKNLKKNVRKKLEPRRSTEINPHGEEKFQYFVMDLFNSWFIWKIVVIRGIDC